MPTMMRRPGGDTVTSVYDMATGTWMVQGVTAEEPPDEEEVYQRAVTEWRKKQAQVARHATNRVVMNAPYVCLACLGDQHLGDPGTDVERCFAEAQIVAETNGMIAATIGDVLNNFVIGKLRQVRDHVRMSIPDEWVLVRRYYRIIGPKLAFGVGGNHDFWVNLLSGVDYFREVVAQAAPHALYDTDDLRLVMEVGGVEFPGRVRHAWQGRSIYNITHGMEKAQKWDQDFIWAVGGHTHESGVVRTFNAGGRNAIACLVGSYKRHDSFAKRIGFPKANGSTGIAILFDAETGTMTGFDNLALAAKVLNHLVGSYKRHDSFAKRIGFPKANGSTGIAILFDAETGTMTGFDNLALAAKVLNHLERAGGSALAAT